MATVTAISTKGGGGGKATLEYICRDDKTDNKKYVTALNCSLPTVYQEFKNTREMYGKTGGIKYYHFVQSHPSGYEIEHELAHRIAVEFAEIAFKGHECVVATHIDAEHIHSHIVFNSVNAETGMKYHSNKFTLNDIRTLSDEICQKYGVQTLEKPVVNQRTDGITTGEYRSAMKGESWKIDLINVIDEVMKQAKTQKQFCFLMRQRGYGVRWEESRKYITYICPNGKRCRDNRLHEPRYSKEMMLNEFKIRADEISFEIKSGRSDEHTTGDLCSRQQAQLTLLTQAVEQVSKEVNQTMTAEQMNYHLENQQVIFNQVKSECKHIQQITAEQTTNSLTSLISQSEKLSLQAGKLNEEYSSKLKESEERNIKRSRKLIGIVIAIQSAQLILWTVLQVLLR